MTDIDPQQAARMAQNTGSQEQQATAQSQQSGSSISDRLFDGSAAGPSKMELTGEYGLEEWSALVLRGVLRAAPGDGMPPIGDISLGGILGIKKYTAEPQQSTSEDLDGGEEEHMTEFQEDWGER